MFLPFVINIMFAASFNRIYYSKQECLFTRGDTEDWLYMYLCAVCDKQILVLILQYSCIQIDICINYLAKHQTLWLTLVYLTVFFLWMFNQQHY